MESMNKASYQDPKVQDFAAQVLVEIHAIRQQLDELFSGGRPSLQQTTAPLSDIIIAVDTRTCTDIDGKVDEEAEQIGNDAEDKESTTAELKRTSTQVALDAKEEEQQELNERAKKRIEHIIGKHQARVNRSDRSKQETASKKAMKEERLLKRVASLDKHAVDSIIDSSSSVVIFANALLIGVSLDFDDNDDFDVWEICNTFITCFFLLELAVKLAIHGFFEFYCGSSDRYSNLFDTVLIVLDCSMTIMSICLKEVSESISSSGLPAPSIFRMLRLARLTRLMRLLRIDALKDLLSMLGGLAGGAWTLYWALILVILIVYVVALVCRECFGNTYQKEVYEYFNTVPRAMFTIFRCSFGDCTSKTGVPIPEYIQQHYGAIASVLYCVLIFFVCIGLFNVISAIFVDATLAANAEATSLAIRQRLLDDELWCDSVSLVVKELLRSTPTQYAYLADDEGNWLDHFDLLLSVEFPRSVIEDVVRSNNKVRNALEGLDIESHEHYRLSDILDPYHNGQVNILELVCGLEKLRGEPRRGDIISLDLMVRSMQDRLDKILSKTISLQKTQQQMRLEAFSSNQHFAVKPAQAWI